DSTTISRCAEYNSMTTRVSGICALISDRTSNPLPGVRSMASLRTITWGTDFDATETTESWVTFATDNCRSRLKASVIKLPVRDVLSATNTLIVLLPASPKIRRVMNGTPKLEPELPGISRSKKEFAGARHMSYLWLEQQFCARNSPLSKRRGEDMPTEKGL